MSRPKSVPVSIQEFWSRHLVYELDTGYLRWKKPSSNITKAGDIVGTLAGRDVKSGGGYLRVNIQGKQSMVHRLIWEHFMGEIPEGMQVDHINGDRLDNRLGNMRLVSFRENHMNKACHREGKLCGFEQSGNRFAVRVRIGGGRRKYIGTFTTKEEAHVAYMKFCMGGELHGD